MTTKEIEIKKKKYEIIEGTQGDGRCFSGAIYYLLFKNILLITLMILNKCYV